MNKKIISLGGQAFYGGIMLCRRNYMATAAVTKNGIKTYLRVIKKKTSKNRIIRIPLFIYNSLMSSFFAYFDYYSLRYGKKIAAIIIAVFLSVLFAFLAILIIFGYDIEKLLTLPTTIDYPNIADATLFIIIIAFICILSSVLPFTRRLFKFHAAEHKIINCIESAGLTDKDNINDYSSYQKRCGTMTVTNILLVLFLLILLIPKNINEEISIAIEIIGISAAIIFSRKLMNVKSNKKIISILRKPGLLFQHITTKKPDEIMIKCAVAAADEILNKL